MPRTFQTVLSAAILTAVIGFSAGSAVAGPFIIAGTDADDHGFVNGGGNQDGWFFMQRSLENIAPGVTNGNKTVIFLGSNPGSDAGNAAQSAFVLSNLPAAGWTAQFVNGVAAINTFLATGIGSAGIVMLDSGANVTGGIDAVESAAVTAGAVVLNNFLGTGGGLFTQANSLGFLSTLIPGINITTSSGSGITLTAAGIAAFPGLTNADLSSGPYHAVFSNFGGLPVLGIESNRPGGAVIIGASGGSITNPTVVPEPSTLGILGLGLAALGFIRRRRGAKAA